MDCPICKVQLVMSERQGIEIDYCPKCRGVWLDRGELDKIIERSVSEMSQNRLQERYNDHRGSNEDYHHKDVKHDHHEGDYHRKKRSLFSDLFD
jgi:uncharacterized protein